MAMLIQPRSVSFLSEDELNWLATRPLRDNTGGWETTGTGKLPATGQDRPLKTAAGLDRNSVLASSSLNCSPAAPTDCLGWPAAVWQQITEYLTGQRRAFSQSLVLEMVEQGSDSEFSKQVLLALTQVSWGETISYGDLARRAGHNGAARAVGTVMRKNRFPIILPCHRVILSGSSARLGNYSGPAGMKEKLLRFEEAKLAFGPCGS